MTVDAERKPMVYVRSWLLMLKGYPWCRWPHDRNISSTILANSSYFLMMQLADDATCRIRRWCDVLMMQLSRLPMMRRADDATCWWCTSFAICRMPCVTRYVISMEQMLSRAETGNFLGRFLAVFLANRRQLPWAINAWAASAWQLRSAQKCHVHVEASNALLAQSNCPVFATKFARTTATTWMGLW